MLTNEDLQRDVQDAIRWEPLLSSAEIGVTAHNGVVTLSGTVDTYSKKLEAEHAAKNVKGVKVIVEKIEMKNNWSTKKTDHEIATDVLKALQWNWQFASKQIKVQVEDGWVTLEGELKWNYQKEAAKRAIKDVVGIHGIFNNITIGSETQDEVEKHSIEDALLRNWSTFNEPIQVKVEGNSVTLTGTVQSLYQKDEAERIAWNAAGVYTVDNQLLIS